MTILHPFTDDSAVTPLVSERERVTIQSLLMSTPPTLAFSEAVAA